MSPRIGGGIALCFAVAAGLLLAGCGRSVSWAPDSRSLAVDVDGKLQIFDLASGRFTPLDTGGHYAVNPAFSPDGKHVAYFRVRDGGADGRICDLWMRDVGSPSGTDARIASAVLAARHESVAEIAAKMRAATPLAWSPDSRKLAYARIVGDDRGMIEIRRVDSGETISLGRPGELQLMPAWSPSGARLAYLARAQSPENGAAFDLYVVRPGDGPRPRRLLDTGVWPYWPITWAENGQGVVVMKQPEGTGFELYLAPIAGGSSRLLTRVDTPQASITPDLEMVAYMGGHNRNTVICKRWPFDQEKVLDRIPFPESAGSARASDVLLYPVVAPDGKSVALPLVTQHPELRVYEVATGRRRIYALP